MKQRNSRQDRHTLIALVVVACAFLIVRTLAA